MFQLCCTFLLIQTDCPGGCPNGQEFQNTWLQISIPSVYRQWGWSILKPFTVLPDLPSPQACPCGGPILPPHPCHPCSCDSLSSRTMSRNGMCYFQGENVSASMHLHSVSFHSAIRPVMSSIGGALRIGGPRETRAGHRTEGELRRTCSQRGNSIYCELCVGVVL